MSPLLCSILFSNCLLLIDRPLFCLGTFLDRSKILSFNNFLFILTFFLSFSAQTLIHFLSIFSCYFSVLNLPSQSPYAFLLLSCSHRLYAFAPFSIFFPSSYPSSTHFLPLSNPICQIFDQLRQQEEINPHFFIHIYIHIHTFSFSPTICPSTTSDQASKCNCLTT